MAGVGSAPFRVGMVDDHLSPVWGIEKVIDGVEDLDFVGAATSVAELVSSHLPLDVVVLDLRLTDGTTPRENVERLTALGIHTIVYTSGEYPDLLRSAARAGTLGVILKSAPEAVVVEAIRRAAAGKEVLTTEWAAAIDADPRLAAVELTPQLQRVLAMYASGETSAGVAEAMGLQTDTINEYLKRIRQRYAEAGRPAHTKLDLFKRAVEDGWLPTPLHHNRSQ